MRTGWILLQSISDQKTELVLREQAIWEDPIREFGLDYRLVSPLEVRLILLPQAGGLLIRGRITGRIVLPCNLCAEDALVELNRSFDSFEPFPPEPEIPGGAKRGPGPLRVHPAAGAISRRGLEEDPEVDEYFIRYSPQGLGLEINPGNLAWEEFLQSVPLRPLCREDCAGLCPLCGQNLNQGQCSCKRENTDSRLEKLRAFTVTRR
ncbi:MAG: DUF177 domain-containing protein [Deltaproteobacteria bacterium]|jgi:uncharacterized protein|nr:DUF177 domain-containing protein [Deltaproteobacteria bacterium]